MSEVCVNRELVGCGGRLCVACGHLLKRYAVLRYESDSMGAPVTDTMPERLTVCGFTAESSSPKSSSRLETPGRSGSGKGMRMTVVAAPEGGLQKNDRIAVDGVIYRVTVAKRGNPAVAVLVEAQQNEQSGLFI